MDREGENGVSGAGGGMMWWEGAWEAAWMGEG